MLSAELDITGLLQRDAPALDMLIPQIYEPLRRLARRQRQRESAHTLQTTALVHETCLVLMKQDVARFSDSAHFYAYVSQVMRHALIDHARCRKALKRQAPAEFALQGEEARTDPDSIIDLLALDEALNRLNTIDARLAQIAQLKLFAELSCREIARVLKVNSRSIDRDWLKARAFLSDCLQAPS
ncbi:ECF-type sigma factor [Dokdonella soli]|uniref:ECF-type sigma factor n=1 Tax=Dokdonella soli TaxID=529810 RepID=A0ABN1IQM7_9GAMM